MNDPKKGGSFYIQSKIVRAYEAINDVKPPQNNASS